MKNKYLVYFIICILFGGIFSVLHKSLPDWDFFSYHFYNGWAIWNDRLNTDFMGASIRTYFNPVLDGVNYAIIKVLNNYPQILMFISGLKLGLFLFLTYLFLDLMIKNEGKEKNVLILSALFLTVISPIVIFSNGIEYLDLQIANLILISFYIYLKNIFKDHNTAKMMFISAFILGCAVGIKYTAFIYFITIILCTILNYKKIKNIKQFLCIFSLGSFIGYITINGLWMYILYKHFNNPIFPYFNNIFHSELANGYSVFVNEFYYVRPHSIFNFLIYPLKNPLLHNVGLEWKYFDICIPIAYFSVIGYVILKLFHKAKSAANFVKIEYYDTFIIFSIIAYCLNLGVFGNFRYIMALIPISFCSIIVMCYLISIYTTKFLKTNNYKKYFYSCFSIIIILALILVKPCGQKIVNIIPQNEKFIYIRDMGIEDGSTVLMGTTLTSFVIPFQNKNAKYIEYTQPKKYIKNINPKNIQVNSSSKKNEELMQEIFNKENNLYFVYSKRKLSFRGVEKMKANFSKQFSEYSNGQISGLNNCRKVYYSIMGNSEYYDSVYICKLR